MKSRDIEFKTVKIKDLIRFAEDTSRSTHFELVPMIRSRAMSLAQNPIADPEDIVLVLAFHGERLVGYMGMMAVSFIYRNTRVRMFWGCTAATVKDQRGSGLSDQMLRFTKDHVNAFCGGGANPNAQKVYLRNGFKAVSVPIAIEMRIFLIRIPCKRTLSRFLELLLKPIFRNYSFQWKDSPNNWLGRGICVFLAKGDSNFKVKELNADLSSYIRIKLENQNGNVFHRSGATLEWMLKTPWWPGEPEVNLTESNYFFYDKKKKIDFKVFEILNNQKQPLGFAVFSIIQTDVIQVKLLDHTYENTQAADAIVRLAFKLVDEKNAHKIEIPPSILKQCTFAWAIPFRKRIIKDNYCVWAKDPVLNEALSEVDAQMTDGDLPFW